MARFRRTVGTPTLSGDRENALPVQVAPRCGLRAILWLVLITALGVALRLYRLDVQSIWLDEWPNVAHLSAPNAMTYVRLIQVLYPEQAQGPLYYFLQYGWAHLFGTSLVVLRLLPLLLGMTAVPLIYVLGKWMYGRWAGLIAALCLALSPQHIWYAQEIRPYSLVTPFVIVSVYALSRALREGGRKWWAVNLAANCLLAWTHLLAILVLFSEGCFLLLFLRRATFKRAALWAGIQLLLLIPWLAWMSTLPYSNEHPSYFHTVRGVFNQIMADDIVSFHTDLLPPWKTNPIEKLSPWLQRLLPAKPGFDWALLFVFCCGALWLVAGSLGPWFRRTRGSDPHCRPANDQENAVLLLLLLLLPGLVLGIMTFVTQRPFLSPMYSMYNTVGLYIGLGGLLAGILGVAARGPAVLLLGALYAYQLAIFLPETTRTDWRAGAVYVKANASSGDLVLDLECFWPVDCLGYYLDGSGIPVRRVTTFQAGCDESAAFFQQTQAAASAPNAKRSAWLVFEVAFFKWLFPAYDLEAALTGDFAARGLTVTWQEFPGHHNLLVLRIDRKPGAMPHAIGQPVAALRPIDYDSILSGLNMAFSSQAQHDNAVAALRHEIAYWPPLNKCYWMMHCIDLVEAGHADLAEGMGGSIIARHPAFGLGHFALGLARLARGHCDGASSSFNEAFRLHAGLQDLLGPFVTALCERRDFEAARREIHELERVHFVFTPALREVCRQCETRQDKEDTRQE